MHPRFWWAGVVGVLTLYGGASVRADEGSAPQAALARRVDELLLARMQAEGVPPAPAATDAEFLRRAYLDLTGRLPRVHEVRSFLADPRTDRRQALIAELLARPDHAARLAQAWRRFLLPDQADLNIQGQAPLFESWLTGKFADHVPYDQLVREILLAQGNVGQPGPALFYTALQLKPEELAASTSRAFLGVQVACAQCHDHPFAAWKQRDFWTFAAFFARLQRPPEAQAQFVFQVQDADAGEVVFPGTDEQLTPQFLGGVASADAEGASRRERLAAWITAPDNPYFAKAAVNRVWALLFGRGLVEPVDDLGNGAVSHPELLEELAMAFVASGFDLRFLVGALAQTEAYGRTSGGVSEMRPELFGRMAVKPLSSEQLYDALAAAVLRPQAGGGAAFSTNRGAFDQQRFAFLSQFRTPEGGLEYQGGIPQALTLMNGTVMQGAVSLEQSDLLLALEAPFLRDEQRLEALFLATLSRPPTDSERNALLPPLAAAATPEERKGLLGDVLWALLNSGEFALNH